MKKWKTEKVAKIYDNPWINLSHREVKTPKNTDAIYGMVHFKNWAVGIIPVDELGKIFFVGQERYTLGSFSIEIPEGGSPLGDVPLESAKRELLEETGLKAAYWEELGRMHTSNSVTDEFAIIYLAKFLVEGAASPEDSEEFSYHKMDLSQAIEAIEKNQITDSLTVFALQSLALKLSKSTD